MATLQYNGTEYNILYIDPTIETAGDGSTPATALLDIPSPLTDKTCYLIRRGPDDEVYNVNMPQSWYEALYEIIFIGMPTKESPLWLALDEDVKEAWGADLGKYARIRCNTTSYTDIYNKDIRAINSTDNKILIKTNTIRNFLADSCYFYRDGEGPSAGAQGRMCNYIFGFDYDSRFANVAFNNCKFGYSQYNFENKDYLDSNTDIAKDTSKYPQYQCASYIAGTNFNTISFTNCIVNVASTVHQNSQSSISYLAVPGAKIVYISGFNKAICNDLQLNILYFDSYNGDNDITYERFNLSGGDRSYLISKNIEINKIYTPTGARIHNRALYFTSNILRVDGIKINHRVMGTGDLESYNEINNTSMAVYLNASISYQISNLYADLTNSPVKYASMFQLTFFRSGNGTVSNKIENICVKGNENGVLNIGLPVVQINGNSSIWNGYKDEVNVSGNNSYGEVIDSGYNHQLVPQKACIAKNVIIDCPFVNTTDNYVTKFYRIGVQSDYLAGRIYLASAVLDVKKVYCDNSNTTAIVIDGNSFVKCDELEVNLSDPNYKGANLLYWQRGSQSSVYIGKTNCIIADDIQNVDCNYIACMNSTLVCPNYIKPGQFFARNYNSFCKSWNVLRTGSNAQGSLRFNNNTNNQHNNILPLVIGQEPYTGFQVMPTSTGKKYMIGYIACKNFDDSELSNGSGSFGYWVNTTEKYTDLFNEEKINTKIHSYASDSFGWLVDNESTWSNDTNLKKYKLIVPIEVFNLEDPIEIKVWFNWYSVNGYCYIDPDFKLVDTI